MVTLEFKNKFGVSGQVQVPVTEDDILFGPYLDYQALREEYFSADEGIKDAQAFTYLKAALSKIVAGDLDDIEPVLPDDLTEGGFPPIWQAISLARLDDHIARLVRAAIDKDRSVSALEYTFDYKGETWHISRKRALSYLGGASFSTGEVIEVVEVGKLMDLLIKRKGDPMKNYAYERDLRIVGILAKREGYELPFEINERMAYVERQMKYFSGLPLSTVLDVRFFLGAILKELNLSLDTIGFLTIRNPLLHQSLEVVKLNRQAAELKMRELNMRKVLGSTSNKK